MQRSKQRQELDKDREFILWVFDGRCVHCGRPTQVIHEIVPLSHGTIAMNWKNRVPLCNLPSGNKKQSCHDWAHSIGTNNSIPILQQERRKFIVRKFKLVDTVSEEI